MRTPSFIRTFSRSGWLVIFVGLLGAMVWPASAQDTPAPSPGVMAEQVAEAATMTTTPATVPGRARVLVIPVRDEIATPILYVMRRGLKQAIEWDADLVVLDMKTPGGSLGTTFEILEALEKFDGETATYVNNEALSAGAFISAMTDKIYFAPSGVIGAAAPVSSTGADIDETMKQKVVSYLKARIRAISEGHPYRGQVISAMIDADYELKVGDEVLKEKGALLSLTATEASQTYGDPAEPLLAAGIAKSIDALLDERFGVGGYEVIRLETTWSEDLAVVMNAISPILLGLGLLGLFIEFKTPGFGVFGIGGAACLLIVFFGQYTAGLSGHEPVVFFGLGAVMVLVELLFFPGVIVMALGGVILMLGSLVWSMADLWPNEPLNLSGDVLVAPLLNLGLGFVVFLALVALLSRFIPSGWFFQHLAVHGAGLETAQGFPMPVIGVAPSRNLVGARGVAETDLFPSGKVLIGGDVFEGRVMVGNLEAGTAVRVVRQSTFDLIVERADG